MSWPRLLLGALLIVIGALWLGQGLGYIGGSFMSSNAFWAAAGAVAVVAGGAIVVLALRRPRAN
ncbi:MAG: hypothetical protein ACXVAE_07750 [Candidatus Limnocylindrales bacterium]